MWASGEQIAIRHVWRKRVFLAWSAIVAGCSDDLVAAWIPPGAQCMRPSVREQLPYEQPLVEKPWQAPGVLQLFPVGAAHALWLFADSWYVNLQEPFRLEGRFLDTADHLLDLVRSHAGRWRWKDEHELEAAVEAGFLTADDAAAIYAEAERVIAADPFPTGWEGWRPDPSWPVPALPPGWDVV